MSKVRWLVFSIAFLAVYYLVREPILRPNKTTVLSWLEGKPIVLAAPSDAQPPVIEPLDPHKVQDLKHEEGWIYRQRFFWPQNATANYSFRYPVKDHTNSYTVDIQYAWWPKVGWIRREQEGIRISGPNNRERLAALGVKD